MTTRGVITGFLFSALGGMAASALASAAQSPSPDGVIAVARFSVSAPASEGWRRVVDHAGSRISLTRRGTRAGSVARVTSIVIGAIEPGEGATRLPGDSLARGVIGREVAAARGEGRASGDFKVGDVQVTDTLAGRLKVYILRYRREMTSWKNTGWAEAMTVYYYFAPDFPEQRGLMRVQVCERFQVGSVGNQAPDDGGIAWSMIGQLQDETTGLAVR
jgi:hypothetical protein